MEMGIQVILCALAGGGLPYCLIHAAKALRDRDDDGLGMFTLGAALSGACLGVFACLAALDVL